MLHFLFLGWEVGSRCPVGALVFLFSPPQLRKSVDATSPANSCARCLGGCRWRASTCFFCSRRRRMSKLVTWSMGRQARAALAAKAAAESSPAWHSVKLRGDKVVVALSDAEVPQPLKRATAPSSESSHGVPVGTFVHGDYCATCGMVGATLHATLRPPPSTPPIAPTSLRLRHQWIQSCRRVRSLGDQTAEEDAPTSSEPSAGGPPARRKGHALRGAARPRARAHLRDSGLGGWPLDRRDLGAPVGAAREWAGALTADGPQLALRGPERTCSESERGRGGGRASERRGAAMLGPGIGPPWALLPRSIRSVELRYAQRSSIQTWFVVRASVCFVSGGADRSVTVSLHAAFKWE